MKPQGAVLAHVTCRITSAQPNTVPVGAPTHRKSQHNVFLQQACTAAARGRGAGVAALSPRRRAATARGAPRAMREAGTRRRIISLVVTDATRPGDPNKKPPYADVYSSSTASESSTVRYRGAH
jgi:hypothetical protein